MPKNWIVAKAKQVVNCLTFHLFTIQPIAYNLFQLDIYLCGLFIYVQYIK